MNAFLSIVISGSVMILFTAAFRALFARRLNKRTFPVLWGIITLRLLIPVTIGIPGLPSSFHLFTPTEPRRIPIPDNIVKDPGITASAPAISTISDLPLAPAENHTSVTPGEIPNIPDIPDIPEISTAAPITPQGSAVRLNALTVIWMVGIALFALYFIVSYVRCMRWFSESLPIGGHEYIDKWLSEHKLLLRKIAVRGFDGITSPLTYAIFRPVILLPSNYGQLSGDELNVILTHEFIHIKRFDTAFKLALTAVLCVYWFDPLVWLMYFLANRDIEFACDEAVLCKLGGSERKTYALTLLRMEELKSSAAPAVTGLGDND